MAKRKDLKYHKSKIKGVKKVVETIDGKALFCLGPKNCIRKCMYKIVKNGYYETMIIICILISTLSLS